MSKAVFSLMVFVLLAGCQGVYYSNTRTTNGDVAIEINRFSNIIRGELNFNDFSNKTYDFVVEKKEFKDGELRNRNNSFGIFLPKSTNEEMILRHNETGKLQEMELKFDFNVLHNVNGSMYLVDEFEGTLDTVIMMEIELKIGEVEINRERYFMVSHCNYNLMLNKELKVQPIVSVYNFPQWGSLNSEFNFSVQIAEHNFFKTMTYKFISASDGYKGRKIFDWNESPDRPYELIGKHDFKRAFSPKGKLKFINQFDSEIENLY